MDLILEIPLGALICIFRIGTNQKLPSEVGGRVRQDPDWEIGFGSGRAGGRGEAARDPSLARALIAKNLLLLLLLRPPLGR